MNEDGDLIAEQKENSRTFHSVKHKSILKKSVDEIYLTQPLLRDSDHFSAKPKRALMNDNSDVMGSMASMVFDSDPAKQDQLEQPALSKRDSSST